MVDRKVGCIPDRELSLISLSLSDNFFGFSLLALLVMNFDRYVATSYPIFHRTSVTKGEIFNSSCNTDYCRTYFGTDLYKHLCYI